MKSRAFLIGIILLSLQALPLYAKCAFKRFRIAVHAADASGHPLTGATVALFANDALADWPTDYVNSSVKTTDSAGTFQGTFYFSTASGGSFFGADFCHRRLNKLEVVVIDPGYRPARVLLTHFPHGSRSVGVETILHVPTVALEPIGEATALPPNSALQRTRYGRR